MKELTKVLKELRALCEGAAGKLDRKGELYLERSGKDPIATMSLNFNSHLLEKHLPDNYQDFLKSPDARVWDADEIASRLLVWHVELMNRHYEASRHKRSCWEIGFAVKQLSNKLKIYIQQAQKDKASKVVADLKQKYKKLEELRKAIEDLQQELKEVGESWLEVAKWNQATWRAFGSEWRGRK